VTAPIVITFSPDGVVEGMHRDEFPLGFLGEQAIKRASDICFNAATQQWDLYLRDHRDNFVIEHEAQQGFPGYDTARRVEVQWLNECRKEGLNPLGLGGIAVLSAIRQQEVT
jgi:hypothetical protein